MVLPPVPSTCVVTECPSCHGSGTRQLLEVRDRVHGLPGRFGLVACTQCNLVRLSPRPAENQLASYYPAESYAPFAAASARGSRGKVRDTARDLLRGSAMRTLGYGKSVNRRQRIGDAITGRLGALQQFGAYRSVGFPPWVAGGRALEVGPGNGSFMAILKRHGWAVSGLDINPVAAAAALQHHGLHVDVGQLGDDPYEPGSFDFIYLRHVIEHVADPKAALERVAALLSDSGCVYIETPNIESTGFRQFGDRWFPLEAPRHLVLFAPRTLPPLMQACGLKVTKMRTSPYITARWAAAFRAGDRRGQVGVATPDVPPAARLGVLRDSLVQRLEGHRDPSRGDILSVWATRSR